MAGLVQKFVVATSTVDRQGKRTWVHLDLEIDWDSLAFALAKKAAANKSGRTTAMKGDIKASLRRS